MFEADFLALFDKYKGKKEVNLPSFDFLFGKGNERFSAGMISLLMILLVATNLGRSPEISEDRFVEAGERFTAPANSIVSGNMRKDLLLGIGYALYDTDPTSGEMYLAIDEPVSLVAQSKGYVRKLRNREIPQQVVERTMEWQAVTPTFCRFGCDTINIRHNATLLDMIPEEPYINLKSRYKQ